MGGRRHKFTVAEIKAALQASKGLVSVTAMTLGCTRATIYNYVARHRVLQEVMDDQREMLVDRAHAGLWDKLTEGDWNAIKFVLERLGKDRGFGEEVRVDMKLRDEREQVRDELLDMLTITGDRLRSRGYTANGGHDD